MKRLVWFAGFVFTFAIPLAAHGYTPDERRYCGPEARRLCSISQLLEAGLGDYSGVIACFKQHRAEISRACVDAIRKGHGR